MADITTGTKLYNLLTTRDFENFKALDSKTSKPPVNNQGQEDISKSNMFVFDWNSSSRKSYGTVVVLLGADKNLQVFFGDNLGKSMEGNDKQEWFDFLYQLKNFATRNFLEFASDNLNKLRYSLQGQSQVNESLFESWVGTRTVSYSGSPTEARLMIKHNRTLGEGDARHRYVESLYIETAEGERFKLPFTKLNGGRAMVEHVRQGGKPYDLRGQHITSMVEEINVLSRFRRANHGKIFEGDTEQLVTETNAYYENISRVLKGLSSSRGYGQYFESWNPNEVTDQELVIEDIKNLFVTQNIDSRIEAALPVLARIQQQGTAMKEANIFEQWIDKLEEGTWALPETPEQKEKLAMLLSKELIVGADATNATEQLYDLVGDDELFDILSNLAQRDADANAWDDSAVMNRLYELAEMDPDLAEVLDVLHQQSAPVSDEENLDEYQINDLGEGLLDTIASKLGHGSDEDMLADLQRKAGLPVTGKKPGDESNAPAHDEHEVDEDGRIITGPHGMMDIEKTPTGMKVSRKNWSDQGGGNGVDPKFHLPSNKGHWSDYDNGDYNDEHEVDETLGYSQDPEQAKWYHEGRKAYKFGTTGNLIQDIAKKHGVPAEWLKAFHAGYQDQEGWGKGDTTEDQLDEFDIDTLNQLASHPMAAPLVSAGGAAIGAALGKGIHKGMQKASDWYNNRQDKKELAQQQGVAEVQLTPQWQDDPEHLEYRKKQADISRNTGLAVGDLVTLKDRPGFEGKIVRDWGGGDFTISGSGGGMSQSNNHRANARNIQKLQGVAEEINSLRRAAGLKENVTLDENGQTLQHILNTFKRDVKDFKATGALSDHLYDALFDYYAPDMPYGVAKARTGDPSQWIADRFGADIGMLNFGSNSPSVNHEETESVGDYAEEVTPEAIAPVLECNMSPFGSQCPVHGIEECVTAGLMEETAEKFDLDRLKALANIR